MKVSPSTSAITAVSEFISKRKQKENRQRNSNNNQDRANDGSNSAIGSISFLFQPPQSRLVGLDVSKITGNIVTKNSEITTNNSSAALDPFGSLFEKFEQRLNEKDQVGKDGVSQSDNGSKNGMIKARLATDSIFPISISEANVRTEQPFDLPKASDNLEKKGAGVSVTSLISSVNPSPNGIDIAHSDSVASKTILNVDQQLSHRAGDFIAMSTKILAITSTADIQQIEQKTMPLALNTADKMLTSHTVGFGARDKIQQHFNANSNKRDLQSQNYNPSDAVALSKVDSHDVAVKHVPASNFNDLQDLTNNTSVMFTQLTTRNSAPPVSMQIAVAISNAFTQPDFANPAGGAVTTLLVRLQPDGLGQVEISLKSKNGILKVHLAAAQDDALRVLQQNSDELKKSLVAIGASIDRVDLTISQSSENRQIPAAAEQNDTNSLAGHYSQSDAGGSREDKENADSAGRVGNGQIVGSISYSGNAGQDRDGGRRADGGSIYL